MTDLRLRCAAHSGHPPHKPKEVCGPSHGGAERDQGVHGERLCCPTLQAGLVGQSQSVRCRCGRQRRSVAAAGGQTAHSATQRPSTNIKKTLSFDACCAFRNLPGAPGGRRHRRNMQPPCRSGFPPFLGVETLAPARGGQRHGKAHSTRSPRRLGRPWPPASATPDSGPPATRCLSICLPGIHHSMVSALLYIVSKQERLI